MMIADRFLLALACAAAAATPLAAAPKAPVKHVVHALKPGPAKCRVNDDKVAPCQIRKSESGGLDVETTGEDPLLAMVVDGGLNLFALVGEDKSRVPLIMDYTKDAKDSACWRSTDSDAVVWRLCVR